MLLLFQKVLERCVKCVNKVCVEQYYLLTVALERNLRAGSLSTHFVRILTHATTLFNPLITLNMCVQHALYTYSQLSH